MHYTNKTEKLGENTVGSTKNLNWLSIISRFKRILHR